MWNGWFGYLVTETVFEDDFETDKGWEIAGISGSGIWMRGDPVGTMDGGNQANPENDSPYDSGAMCYVTENGAPGAGAGENDVDTGGKTTRLRSPHLDLSGYKSGRILYDLWYYDNSSGNPTQDGVRH